MARAQNFSELIDLIGRAEAALIVGGITDPEQRLLALRGIYYGTPWSTDFRVERSQLRNIGMTVFTGFGIPIDPRTILGTRLFNDLRRSQDVTNRGLKIDVGHTLIGMEARSNAAARTITIPGHGGTGIEIVTWLGDLGGGAANLAWRRSQNSSSASRSVRTVFLATGSDYGAPINLEGDVAGNIIGSSSFSSGGPGAPLLSATATIQDAFSAYLPTNPAGRRSYYSRSRNFLIINGGRFSSSPSNRLRNRTSVATTLAGKIRDFAVPYILQRYIVGQNQPRARIERACKHIAGASSEVALTFVKALEANVASPRTSIRARGPWASATPPASSCAFRSMRIAAHEREATESINETIRSGRNAARDFLDGIKDLVD